MIASSTSSTSVIVRAPRTISLMRLMSGIRRSPNSCLCSSRRALSSSTARTSGGGQGMATQLARLIYRMLRYGMKYADQGAEFYDGQHRKQQVTHLKRKAAQLGLQIIEVAPAA